MTTVIGGQGVSVDQTSPTSYTISNTGVLSVAAGAGIDIDQATGDVTISGAGPAVPATSVGSYVVSDSGLIGNSAPLKAGVPYIVRSVFSLAPVQNTTWPGGTATVGFVTAGPFAPGGWRTIVYLGQVNTAAWGGLTGDSTVQANVTTSRGQTVSFPVTPTTGALVDIDLFLVPAADNSVQVQVSIDPPAATASDGITVLVGYTAVFETTPF